MGESAGETKARARRKVFSGSREAQLCAPGTERGDEGRRRRPDQPESERPGALRPRNGPGGGGATSRARAPRPHARRARTTRRCTSKCGQQRSSRRRGCAARAARRARALLKRDTRFSRPTAPRRASRATTCASYSTGSESTPSRRRRRRAGASPPLLSSPAPAPRSWKWRMATASTRWRVRRPAAAALRARARAGCAARVSRASLFPPPRWSRWAALYRGASGERRQQRATRDETRACGGKTQRFEATRPSRVCSSTRCFIHSASQPHHSLVIFQELFPFVPARRFGGATAPGLRTRPDARPFLPDP